MDISLVIAVDEKHLHQLTYSMSTWIRYKTDIINFPLIIIYDAKQIKPNDKRFEITLPFRNRTFVEWNPPNGLYKDQRENMLTSLVQGIENVKTSWYVQIDTDVYATSNQTWIDPSWFNSKSVMVSNPWGYTKPANTLDILDDWGDTTELLKSYPRLNIPVQPGSDLVVCSRIASWIIFARTDWTLRVLEATDKIGNFHKLPIPSQDTLLWYCAKRSNQIITRTNFKKMGWGVVAGTRKLQRITAQI